MLPNLTQFPDESRFSRRLRSVGAAVVRLTIAWTIAALFMALVASAAEPIPFSSSARVKEAQHFVSATSVRVFAAVDRERHVIRRDPTRVYTIVNDIVGRHVDIERVSRLVLGKYWRMATPTQQERFKSVFLAKLIETYVGGISNQVSVFDMENTDITYLSSKTNNDGTDVTVRTRLSSGDARSLRVNYRLHRSGDTWKLYDIAIEGVSLVLTYRSSYAAEIERTGIDGLIERVRSEAPGAYREHRIIGRTVDEGN